MSAPAPVTVNVLPLRVDEPVRPTAPMSPSLQPLGSAPPLLTETESKTPSAVASAMWLLTASPTSASPGRLIESLPACVHDEPSKDAYAVTVEPDRVSF